MAENTSQGTVSGIKQAWRNPKAKKGMILGGALVGVILLVSYAALNRESSRPTGPAASARVVSPPSGMDDVTGKTQENYKQLVREADEERSQKAKSNTTAMVLPRVTGMSDPEQLRRDEEQRLAAERGKARAQEQAAAQPPVRTSAQQAGVQTQVIDPDEALRQTNAYRTSLQLLQRVANVGTGAQGAFSPMMTPANLEKQGANQGGPGMQPIQNATGSSNTATNMALLNPPKPLIRAGEVAFANTDIALNSDYSGPIIATIREGKFNGARLMGQKSLERDAVVIRFTTLSPADGTASFPIQAYAVSLGDARTFGLTGLQGEMDYHVLERYVLPGAISFVQAFGLSAGQKGSTAVVNEGGVGTTTPGLTNSDRVAVALGSAMTPLINDIRQRGNRPITVLMPAGTEIGIMFGADVQNPMMQRQNAMGGGGIQSGRSAGFAGASSTTASMVSLQQEADQAQMASNATTQRALQQYQQMNSVGGYGAPANSSPYNTSPYGQTNYGAMGGYQQPGTFQQSPGIGTYR